MKLFLTAIIFICTFSSAWANDELLIENAWVREGPPRATVLAGYLTIKNTSATPYTLIEVSSPQFDLVEMHESYEKGGMARMRQLSTLPIPANGELKLAPNGYHLMLMDPNQRIHAGMTVDLILKFDSLKPIQISAPVVRKVD